jgi:hypothetical protein
MIGLEDYIELMMENARELWGDSEAEKISKHLEKTATAVWRISQINLGTRTEPATKLRHREKK